MTMTQRTMVSLAVSLLLAAAGCTGLEDDLHYLGEPGQVTSIELVSWVPAVQATAAGRQGLFLLDTGSPATVVSRQLGVGSPLRLEALGLTFPGYSALQLDLQPAGATCTASQPSGVVGGDIMRFFALGLDYRNKRAALFGGSGRGTAWAPQTGAEVSLPLELLGSGPAQVPGSGQTLTVPSTWVYLGQATLGPVSAAAVLDTGASFNLLSPALWQRLAQGTGGTGGQGPGPGPGPGPAAQGLCCPAVDTVAGQQLVQLVRIKELRLGAVTVQQVPAAVPLQPALFQALAQAAGRPVDLVLGGSFLRHFAVTVDYPARRLLLARHTAQDHVPAAEFVRPGISVCRTDQGLTVQEVFRGTDAYRKGVRVGQVLLALDGVSTQGWTEDQALAAFRAKAVGSSLTLRLQDPAGTATDLAVLVENLLPDVP